MMTSLIETAFDFREAVAMVISRPKGGYIHVEYPLVGLDILFDFNYIAIHVSHSHVLSFVTSFTPQITTSRLLAAGSEVLFLVSTWCSFRNKALGLYFDEDGDDYHRALKANYDSINRHHRRRRCCRQ